MMTKKLEIKCPHCKELFNYYESAFRPFCSERCKMVDLGHWLSGSYTVPLENIPIDETEADFEIEDNEDWKDEKF